MLGSLGWLGGHSEFETFPKLGLLGLLGLLEILSFGGLVCMAQNLRVPCTFSCPWHLRNPSHPSNPNLPSHPNHSSDPEGLNDLCIPFLLLILNFPRIQTILKILTIRGLLLPCSPHEGPIVLISHLICKLAAAALSTKSGGRQRISSVRRRDEYWKVEPDV